MRMIWLLLRKDLLRRLRDPLSVLVMLAFPLVFAGIMALALGGSSTPQAELLIHNEDPMLGRLVIAAFGAEQTAEFVRVVEVGEEGRDLLRSGQGSALLHIPEGSTGKILGGETVTFELIRNPSENILPEIAEQTSAVVVDVIALLGRFLQERAGDLGVESLKEYETIANADFAPLMLSMEKTFQAGERYLQKPPLELRMFDVDKEGERTPRGGTGGGTTTAVFAFVLPGLAVYALFLIGDQMMRDLLAESQDGTLRRQLTAPITAGQVVVGKVLTAFLVGGAAFLILTIILVGATDVRLDPIGSLLLAIGIVLASTGFASSIYGIVRNDRQGSAVSSITILMMAFAGGAFIPLSQLPDALRAVSPASPFYWGTRGFHALIDEAGAMEILPKVGVLCAMGVILLGLGTTLIHRRLMRGDAA